MISPISGLAIDALYSVGDWDGYCHLVGTVAGDKEGTYYRIEYQRTDGTGPPWWWQAEIPWEQWFFGISVKFAHAPPGAGGPGGEMRLQIVKKIRVTTLSTLQPMPSGGWPFVVIDTPTDLTSYHELASNFSYVSGGDIGDPEGYVTVRWDDLSRFIYTGKITLTKYGLTSQGAQQTIFQQNFTSYPFTYFQYTSAPNLIQMRFKLIPAGVIVPGPPAYWDPAHPPSTDPAAPLWVAEGDLLTFVLQTDNGVDTIISTFSLNFYHTARFYQFSDSATRGQPYSNQLEIIQDPWVPIPISATFFAISGLPPGFILDPDGTLHCSNPATVGIYGLIVGITNLGNSTTSEETLITVNTENKPVMKAPPQTISLTWGVPYPVAFTCYATNHPATVGGISAYRITVGALPAGLTLDGNTGIISGTPTLPVAPYNITFVAHNAVGDSDPYITSWAVVLYEPPHITSALTLEADIDDALTYQLTSDNLDNSPVRYRAVGLEQIPNLVLNQSVITGTPAGPPGIFFVNVQAANRWGWGPFAQITVTVEVVLPVIISPLVIQVPIGNFSYQIRATHSPFLFQASWPDGLDLRVDPTTGLITGTLTDPTQKWEMVGTPPVRTLVDHPINIFVAAINGAGQGYDTVMVTVVAPPPPIIDTSVTHGRAITWDTSQYFTFSPVASNTDENTVWTAGPIPPNLNLSTPGVSGTLSGYFRDGGLFPIGFTAANLGGTSALATFWFLVSLSPTQAEVINTIGSIVEIWIDLETGGVGIGNLFNQVIDPSHPPQPPNGQSMTVKRGDSLELHVVFHEKGTPVELQLPGVPSILQTLKFGARTGFDDDYVVYTEAFTILPPDPTTNIGGFIRMLPDFSQENEDLDSLIVTTTTPLMGEIQWEILDGNGNIVRRSCQIFTINVLRDLIHPD